MGFLKQNNRRKAENGDFQVIGSLLYAHYPIYFFLLFEQYLITGCRYFPNILYLDTY